MDTIRYTVLYVHGGDKVHMNITHTHAHKTCNTSPPFPQSPSVSLFLYSKHTCPREILWHCATHTHILWETEERSLHTHTHRLLHMYALRSVWQAEGDFSAPSWGRDRVISEFVMMCSHKPSLNVSATVTMLMSSGSDARWLVDVLRVGPLTHGLVYDDVKLPWPQPPLTISTKYMLSYVYVSAAFNYSIQIVWKLTNLALHIDATCFVDAHLVVARIALKRFCKMHPFSF